MARLRFNLRVLFLFVAVCAIAAWGVSRYLIDPIRDEAKSRQTFEKLGAQVYERPREPKWLWDAVGNGSEKTGISLILSKLNIGNDDLRELHALKNIRGLYLDETKITDEGLVHLNELTDLIALSLRKTQITKVPPLENMPHMQDLDLAFTQVGEADYSNLLELQSLNLRATRINNAVLRSLQHLPKLKSLDIAGEPGAPPNEITDEGLKYLEGISTLRTLYLYDTRVTNAGVQDLQKANPALKIIR